MPFQGFTPFTVRTASGIDIYGVKGGEGPPLLLLHGHPQTHMIWHRCVDELARHFTVIATDLRGYGASSKPDGDSAHITYSKRAMAAVVAPLLASASASARTTACAAMSSSCSRQIDSTCSPYARASTARSSSVKTSM